jgi:hypothetical protein
MLSVGSLGVTATAAEKKKDTSQAEKKEKAPEWAELFGGATLPVVWQSVSAASEKIDAALAARKFTGVADWAETIHLGSHALEDQVKVPDAERAKRLKGAFEQAAKIADDVLDAANHKKLENAVEAQRRLKSALTLAKTRMPKEILDAPNQEVRFAKGSGYAPGEKGEQVQKKE